MLWNVPEAKTDKAKKETGPLAFVVSPTLFLVVLSASFLFRRWSFITTRMSLPTLLQHPDINNWYHGIPYILLQLPMWKPVCVLTHSKACLCVNSFQSRFVCWLIPKPVCVLAHGTVCIKASRKEVAQRLRSESMSSNASCKVAGKVW